MLSTQRQTSSLATMWPLSWPTTHAHPPSLRRCACQEPADWTSLRWRECFTSLWKQSDSTRCVYRASWNRFLSFTRILPLPATPITAKSAILFAAYLGSERLSVSTIASYMATLRHFCVVSDPNCPLPSLHSPYLKVLLRDSGSANICPHPAPYHRFFDASDKGPALPSPYFLSQDAHLGACSVGFFGFLQAGKLSIPNCVQFNPNRHLLLEDIVLDTSAPWWRFLVTIRPPRPTSTSRVHRRFLELLDRTFALWRPS